jgi:hypothetical protein
MVGWRLLTIVTTLKTLKNKLMAKLDYKPISLDNKAEALEAIASYKKQNPVKYEMKKVALFARYGLTPDEEPQEIPDSNDLELAVIKKKVTKK